MVETWKNFKSPEIWGKLMNGLDFLPEGCTGKRKVLVLGSYRDEKLLVELCEHVNDYNYCAFLLKDLKCDLNPLYVLKFLLIISDRVFHITEELTKHGHIFEAGFVSMAQEFIDKTVLFMRKGLEPSYMVTKGMLRFFEEGKNLFFYEDRNELFELAGNIAAEGV